MAVKTYYAKQLADDYRKRPTEDHGKLRIQFFEVEVAAGDGGDATSVFELFDLPPGAVRVLPYLSRIDNSALGAGVTLHFGHRSYESRDPYVDGTGITDEDLDAFTEGAAINVAAAGDAVLADKLKFDLYSKAGVRVTAQAIGGAVPAGAKISGAFIYVYE